MSRDSRSRSRSPIDDDDSRRSRRHERKKFERNRSSLPKGSSERRIFVSNIPFECKWQDLKDLFRIQVGNVSYVEMFNDENGRPKGSAVVEFDSFEMAQKAIDKMHRFEVKGRTLIVKENKDANPSRNFPSNQNFDRDRGSKFNNDMDRQRGSFHQQSFSTQLSQPVNYGNTYGLSINFLESLGIKGPLVNKVFVANLDYKVDKEDLTEVFKVAGVVKNLDLIKDQDGKSRGFAVIEYEHPIQAVQAISMLHNQSYRDRKLSVRLDRVAEKHQNECPVSKLPPGLKGLGMGLGSHGEPITDVSKLPVNTANTLSGIGPMGNMSSAMPVGGNNYDLTSMNRSNQLNMTPNMNAMAFMGMAGMDQLNNGLNNSSTMGIGLGNHLGVMGNLSSNNMMGSGGLVMPSAMSNMTSLPVSNAFNSAIGMGNSGVGVSPLYGGNMNSNFNNTSSKDRGTDYGAVRNVIQINNLPMNYTWQSLKDLCRDYGDIRFAEIRAKGTGLVRFGGESEARRAADVLNRQRFDGRLLDVQLL